MNSIIELKQAYVCGAFVGRGFCPCTILSIADAFSIIPNNYIFIFTYIYAGGQVCVCACSIYKVKMSQA